jgi:hypothetical protein
MGAFHNLSSSFKGSFLKNIKEKTVIVERQAKSIINLLGGLNVWGLFSSVKTLLSLLLHQVMSLKIVGALQLFNNVIAPLFISIFFFVYATIFFKLSLIKIVGGWSIVLLLIYWLLSGFNFFLKRYRFGKFTASLQRF